MSTNLSKLIYAILDTITYGYEPAKTAGLKSVEDSINNLTQKILEKAYKYSRLYHHNTITIKDINLALKDLAFPPLFGCSNLSEDLKNRPYNIIAPTGKAINIGDVIRKYLLDPPSSDLFFTAHWLVVEGNIAKVAENASSDEIYSFAKTSESIIDAKAITESYPAFGAELTLSVEVKKMFSTLTKRLMNSDPEQRFQANQTLQKEQLSDLMASLLQFFQNILIKKSEKNNKRFILEALYSLSCNQITNLEPYLHILIQLISVFLLTESLDFSSFSDRILAAESLNNIISMTMLIHPTLAYCIARQMVDCCGNVAASFGVVKFMSFLGPDFIKEFIFPKLHIFVSFEEEEFISLMNETLRSTLQDFKRFLTVKIDDKIIPWGPEFPVQDILLGDFELGLYLSAFNIEEI